MVQDLTFTTNERNRYESKFLSSGTKACVQLKVKLDVEGRMSNDVLVYGNLDDMDRVTIANLGRSDTGKYLFEVDVPADVTVTIECLNEPIEGKVTTAE